MKINIYKHATLFILAFIICLAAVTTSRILSPTALVQAGDAFLAWLPLSAMLSIILLFGRRSILPIVVAFALINHWLMDLSLREAVLLLFCQIAPVLLACALVRWRLGSRWRYAFPDKYMGVRIFWLGFFAPAGIKLSMYLANEWFDYPVSLSSFSDPTSVIYNIIDLQSLICAVLIFTPLFYYPLRMLVNPHYARTFWRRSIIPIFSLRKRIFTVSWLLALSFILIVLCSPIEAKYIAGYLVPIVFILFMVAVREFTPPLIALSWGIAAWFLVAYNRNFLHGVGTDYSLAFVLSVLIAVTICILYTAHIYHRSEWLRRVWKSQALTDPLTGLPNLRALEQHLEQHPHVVVCCLHLQNLEFLSRHYGMMMRVHCKRSIARDLQPLMLAHEKLFRLPGSELLLVLDGQEPEARLQHMVDYLNSRKIFWHNTPIEIEFGASWGVIEGAGENLHHTLGQLSWLSGQASTTQRVLALTQSIDRVTDQTTGQVLMLNSVKRALEEGGLVLYAQPVRRADGSGYHEILTRLQCDGEIVTPDRFIPVISRFNLSPRFDMLVVETLLRWLRAHPVPCDGARFSVNLMPMTLMQKASATELIALFTRYGVSPQCVIIEITEEQAFSHAEATLHNIQQLRDFGFKIAIDDFGTGYANFERLKRLHADIIKIDGTFVKDIERDPLDAMIVQAICTLAKAKSLTVVAEFVETQAQRELLLELGVEYLQGYLLGKPQPLGD
ncbi:sensor domain-containing phosphodiesterase [Enterobacter sp. PGRG2]|uniref:sensor domain-containing phosphodiesterase n=1 Tax=Enterobacter sp. PGRG2 TaxID=3104013 RepID=UPI002ABD6C85|nr:sensor domain-containing phosphodiesterase [Enterobacter sp. PGRG2]WJD47728.1 sensor domain-containing phosphodiesterase [Enterobacter sp. PGRG2]